MWSVYHFRGIFQAKFSTEEEALEWINKQKIASEYYRDYQHEEARDTSQSLPNTTCTPGQLN